MFAVLELVLAALAATRERSRFAYIAPYLKQSKGVAWDYLKALTANIPGRVINESELWVELPNGSRIRLYGADNADALRGIYLDGIVLDEVADMRPNVWGEVIRPTLSDRLGWAIFIGTPKGVNFFSKIYFEALKGTDPEWRGDLRRGSETGAITEAELESAKKSMTPQQYAQEYDCDFAAAVGNVLFPLEIVLAAQQRTLAEADYNQSAKILGVDVARYGDDRTSLFPRQGLAGMKPKVMRGLDTMEVAAQVAHYWDQWHPHAVFVDQGGMGAGVIDRLRQLGRSPIGIDFGSRALDPRFENKRAEMWWLAAEWTKAGGALPELEELTAELTAPTFTYANARGRLQLESKDDLRARGLPSPDIGDSFVLTFAMPVAAPGLLGGPGPQRGALSDYDPYREQHT